MTFTVTRTPPVIRCDQCKTQARWWDDRTATAFKRTHVCTPKGTTIQ